MFVPGFWDFGRFSRILVLLWTKWGNRNMETTLTVKSNLKEKQKKLLKTFEHDWNMDGENFENRTCTFNAWNALQ